MHDNLCRRNICNFDPSDRTCGLVNYRIGYAAQNIQRCAGYQRLWGKYGQRQWIGHTFITSAKGMGMTDFGYRGWKLQYCLQNINNSGRAVGFSGLYDDYSGYHSAQAFVTGASGSIVTNLGTPINSRADGINDFWQVAGRLNSFCDYCTHSSFLYSDNIKHNNRSLTDVFE